MTHDGGYTVETLAITGKWVPWFGTGQSFVSLFRASFETFHARLLGMRSRITHWPSGVVVSEVPPRALYVSPSEVYGVLRAFAKIHGTTPMGRHAR